MLACVSERVGADTAQQKRSTELIEFPEKTKRTELMDDERQID